MSNALSQLRPLLALTGVFLIGFAGIALWQVRRAVRDLGKSEQLAWTLAHEDMLTGLPNHRKMIELIDGALAGRAHGEVVTLAFLDLDGLKDINDALGHRIGDELLKAFAARIKDVLPPRAFCGRFDGDEFALVMMPGRTSPRPRPRWRRSPARWRGRSGSTSRWCRSASRRAWRMRRAMPRAATN